MQADLGGTISLQSSQKYLAVPRKPSELAKESHVKNPQAFRQVQRQC